MPADSVVDAVKRARRASAWASCSVLALLAAPVWPQAVHSEPQDLPFSSFFRQPIGPRGLEISDTLRAADGRRVRLVGYMVAQESPTAGRFMFTPRPVRMSEHADGEADDLPPAVVTVLLDSKQHNRIVPHQPGLLTLVGHLSVGRTEDPSGRVSWVRLQLAPEALAANPLATPPGTPPH